MLRLDESEVHNRFLEKKGRAEEGSFYPRLRSGKEEENEQYLLLQCTRSIRVVLSSSSDKLPIQLCLQQGALPLLLQAICCRNRDVAFEAAWCLTNLASGSSEDVSAMVASGCLVILFALLFSFDPRAFSSYYHSHNKDSSSLLSQEENENDTSSENRQSHSDGSQLTVSSTEFHPPPSPQCQERPLHQKTDEEVLEQILWALGNIAGDSSHFRDLLISPQAFLQHLQQIEPSASSFQATQPHFYLIHHYIDILNTLQKTRRSLIERSPLRLLLPTTTEFVRSPHMNDNYTHLPFPSLQDQLLVLLPYCRHAQTWKTGVWFLSNLCRGHPKPELSFVTPTLPLLQHVLMEMKDEEALADALWALDGIAGHARGAGLIAEDQQLLTCIVHILAHCTDVCCCRCDDGASSLGNAVPSSSNQSSECVATPVFPSIGSSFDNWRRKDEERRTGAEGVTLQPCRDVIRSKRRNHCCRVCMTDGGTSRMSTASGEDLPTRTERDGRGKENLPCSYQLCIRPALRIIGQIATGSVQQTQRLVDCCKRKKPSGMIDHENRNETIGESKCSGRHFSNEGESLLLGNRYARDVRQRMDENENDRNPVILDILRVLIRHERKAIRKDCGWCLSNMAVGSLGQLAALMNSDLISLVLSRLLPTSSINHKEEEEDVRREFLWVIINASTTAASDRSIIISLIKQGIVHPICEMMRIIATSGGDLKAAIATVDAAFNIFEQILSPTSSPSKSVLDITNDSHYGERENLAVRHHSQNRVKTNDRMMRRSGEREERPEANESRGEIFNADRSHHNSASMGGKDKVQFCSTSSIFNEDLHSHTQAHCCSCKFSRSHRIRSETDESPQNNHLDSWTRLCSCCCHHIFLLTCSLFLEQDFPYFLHLMVGQVQQKAPGEISSIPHVFFARIQYLIDHLLQMKSILQHQEFLIRQLLEQYSQYCEANLVRAQRNLSLLSEKSGAKQKLAKILDVNQRICCKQQSTEEGDGRRREEQGRGVTALLSPGNDPVCASSESLLPLKRHGEEISMDDNRKITLHN
ncbi:armadillo beta-catenin family repeat-containing protein [Cystoisospora suis]|uniref:Armadillo beta-catenin family repeat-containing protein n=1 Tax=Cystoisospora suis TaxID=483139 RepID=A0A2C6KNR2_9APIC|nr:armadillo beta-catenin family repeat-containing protein [Cystoisospora suis]